MTTTLGATHDDEVAAHSQVEAHEPLQEAAVARGALPLGRARTIALVSLFLASTVSTTGQLAGAAGVAVLGSVFFSVVDAHASAVPVERFRPAMQVALAALVALMLAAAVVARQLPATMSAPAEGAATTL